MGPTNIPKKISSFTSVGSNFTKKIPNTKEALDQYISLVETENEYHALIIDQIETGYSWVPNKRPPHQIVNFWFFSTPPPQCLFGPTLFIYYSKYLFNHLYQNWGSEYKHSNIKISIIKYEKNM